MHAEVLDQGCLVHGALCYDATCSVSEPPTHIQVLSFSFCGCAPVVRHHVGRVVVYRCRSPRLSSDAARISSVDFVVMHACKQVCKASGEGALS